MAAAPRVLILTASYGWGHHRVAQVLAAAFRRAGAEASVVDHFREVVHPLFDSASRLVYYWILRNAPGLWGAAYWLGDQIPTTSRLLLGVNRLGVRKLGQLLEATHPDLVVTVHATPAAALCELRRTGRSQIPHATVFTDFVAHTQWIFEEVDQYFVPAAEIVNDLAARGIPQERVAVSGLPVGEEFTRPLDKAAARLALGLSPRGPVLLLMGGGQGSLGGLETAVRALLGVDRPFQALVVAGRGERFADRLRQLCRGREGQFRVFGYTESVHQFMAAADLLVTKAGGVTLAEAMAADLPMVCFGSLPGQEARNERFATRAGIALLARSPADLLEAIFRPFDDPPVLKSLRDNIRRVRRPRAAEAVVEALLGRPARIAKIAS
ncbi:MAG: glycosyltransferase [Candidatus Rokubacteria bacterium]|nr:glycosyltransferase [Candidatus Rokubacteria bacterium]